MLVDSYRSHLFTWELNKIKKKNGVFVSFSDVILCLYRSNLVHKGVMYNSLTGGLIGGLVGGLGFLTEQELNLLLIVKLFINFRQQQSFANRFAYIIGTTTCQGFNSVSFGNIRSLGNDG